MSTTKGRAQLSPGGGGGRTASSSCGLVRVVAPPPQEMVKREREDLARIREGSAFETPALILNADGGTNIWVFFFAFFSSPGSVAFFNQSAKTCPGARLSK
jgi:hypothetical protein